MQKIRKISKWIFMAFAALMLTACGTYEVKDDSGQSMMNSAGVYTLVNLHPDTQRSRLYTVNYQMDGLIPLCSEVVLLEASKKVLKFKVKDTNQAYSFYYHRSAGMPLMDYLTKFFGRDCKTSSVEKLSAVDQKGIKEGIAIKGMSRKGVIFAMGYPPPHKTPSLESDSWTFWVNRYGTMRVTFDKKGLVSDIVR